MQHTDTLTTIFRHHHWANLLLLEQCKSLTNEQMDATVPGVYGSIRETWQHIAGAEQSYFSRISTGQPFPRSQGAPPPTLAEVANSLHNTGSGLIEWARRVQADEMVQVDWDGTPRDVPKTILVTQAVNHATEHRAQIATILTHLGIEPPSMDGWSFFDEAPKV